MESTAPPCVSLSVGSRLLILVRPHQSASPPITLGAHFVLFLLFCFKSGLRKTAAADRRDTRSGEERGRGWWGWRRDTEKSLEGIEHDQTKTVWRGVGLYEYKTDNERLRVRGELKMKLGVGYNHRQGFNYFTLDTLGMSRVFLFGLAGKKFIVDLLCLTWV